MRGGLNGAAIATRLGALHRDVPGDAGGPLVRDMREKLATWVALLPDGSEAVFKEGGEARRKFDEIDVARVRREVEAVLEWTRARPDQVGPTAYLHMDLVAGNILIRDEGTPSIEAAFIDGMYHAFPLHVCCC